MTCASRFSENPRNGRGSPAVWSSCAACAHHAAVVFVVALLMADPCIIPVQGVKALERRAVAFNTAPTSLRKKRKELGGGAKVTQVLPHTNELERNKIKAGTTAQELFDTFASYKAFILKAKTTLHELLPPSDHHTSEAPSSSSK